MNIHSIDFIHPELKDGEVFFTNSSLSDFQEMAFKTKRMGKVAFDGKGNQLNHEDWYPVFIKIEELELSEKTLSQTRIELN